jgi:superfamily II DNA or RNA helicase
MQSGTGSGKTATLGYVVQNHQGASCIIAHRTEILSQLSLTLGRYGIRHDLIAAASTRKAIARAHVEELGTCYYQPGARCRVAGVDTLIKARGLETWFPQVTLVVHDEGHHTLRANKWGTVTELFTHPSRRMLLPTATPKRADGKGLGSHHDGYADTMVNGPSMRWLIDQGYLCDYRVYCPPSDMHVAGDVPASGDYSPAQLSAAASKSHIVGDLPLHYARFGEGGTGISFCVNIEIATATAEAYRALGISAEVVTGATHDYVRRDIFRKFGRGEILQLCVVDIVSEGTDLPSCRVGSFGRPSESLALVWQQMGRVLRPDYAPGYPLDTQAGRLAAIAASAKPYAIFIDHVGHFTKPHIGPPDRHIEWSLDRRDKRASTAATGIPLRTCRNESCYKPYPATARACTHCGWTPEPAGRSTPAQVEGDLALLDPAVLAALRGNVLDVEQSPEAYRAEQIAKGARPEWLGKHVKARADAQAAQIMLRAAMSRWGAATGLDDIGKQRLWFAQYGIDVLSAQALGAADAWALLERVDSAVNSGRVLSYG